MKKLFAIILAIGLLLCACGFDDADIELSIRDDSVSRTGLTYELKVKEDVVFKSDSLDFYVEQKVDGEWVRVNDNHVVAQPETYRDGILYAYTISWDWQYGELSSGNYRFCKQFVRRVISSFLTILIPRIVTIWTR